MIVLDTNVLSEIINGNPDRRMIGWWMRQQGSNLYVSTITQAEMLLGSALLPHGRRRTQLAEAFHGLFSEDLRGRILSFDEQAAHNFAAIVSVRQRMGRPISQSDAMIAAISRSNNASVATRNTKDFEHCGVPLINPWEE